MSAGQLEAMRLFVATKLADQRWMRDGLSGGGKMGRDWRNDARCWREVDAGVRYVDPGWRGPQAGATVRHLKPSRGRWISLREREA